MNCEDVKVFGLLEMSSSFNLSFCFFLLVREECGWELVQKGGGGGGWEVRFGHPPFFFS